MQFPRVIVRVAVTAVAFKATIIAILAMLIIPSTLTDFEKGIIIAGVSATITGLFTVFGAWIAVRYTRPIHEEVRDVKHKIEADRRTSDQGAQ